MGADALKMKCCYKNCIVYQQLQLDRLLIRQEIENNQELELQYELDK